MFVCVNGARLYVDIEGAGLVPDGLLMREKPTLLLLHGGPGGDHSIFKPLFSQLSDLVQIVYYDHRGNGRSGGQDPATWTLAQWGDDVRGLCEALGIEKPIVYGVSFGGFVAQAYATRHPGHARKLVLASTAATIEFQEIFAAFERVGGARARAVAEAYWLNPTAESRAAYFNVCLPLYSASPTASRDWLARTIVKNDVAFHFNGPDNEQGRMDFRADLARVTCPVLVLSGDRDPIMPPAFSSIIAASLPPGKVRLQQFAGCSHSIAADDPAGLVSALRTFIAEGETTPA